MERIDVIVGTKLIEIQKKNTGVTLRFQDRLTDSIYILTFKGLLFETSAPTLNKKITDIQISNTIGFRAISQLRNLNQNPVQYHQLFIQMENRTEDKAELIGVFKSYRLQRSQTPDVARKRV